MNLDRIKQWAKALKKNLYILYRAYKHEKTPWYAKALIGVTVAYAMSPIDLIPDFIPVLGYLDDLLLIPAGIALSFKLIPAEVIEECKKEENNSGDMKSRGIYGAIAIGLIWALIVFLIIRAIIKH
jgi:uncharacterized membrane protein YkvA (DUF1232 family)